MKINVYLLRKMDKTLMGWTKPSFHGVNIFLSERAIMDYQGSLEQLTENRFELFLQYFMLLLVGRGAITRETLIHMTSTERFYFVLNHELCHVARLKHLLLVFMSFLLLTTILTIASCLTGSTWALLLVVACDYVGVSLYKRREECICDRAGLASLDRVDKELWKRCIKGGW